MRKLSLNLNDLRVESFETDAQVRRTGTVQGYWSQLNCVIVNRTDAATCPQTCDDATCVGSCQGTSCYLPACGTCESCAGGACEIPETSKCTA